MLKAINPNDTKTIEISGAKFQIGTVPYIKFIELQAKLQAIGKVDIERESGAIYGVYVDYLRWGVKGHSDITWPDGKPVEFKTEEVQLDGIKFNIVSKETVQVYVLNKIYMQLAGEVMKYNVLSDGEEKN